MFDVDVFNLALPKAKNSHFLKRYVKFIEWCRINNELNCPTYVERHHILPKAGDLFPEFADITVHIWNSIDLSFRQHLIAHVMLWKIFGGSQILALRIMLNENADLTSNRKVPTCLELRYLEKIKLDFVAFVKNKRYYYDNMNNVHLLEIGDPSIKKFGLKGNSANTIWYNDGIKSFRLSKNKAPKSHWIAGRLIEFSDDILKKMREQAKGSVGYNDGITNFFVNADDKPEPHWVKGILADAEKHKASLAKRSTRFANSKWYNDGIRNFNVAAGDLPDPDWIEGKICNFSKDGLDRLSKKAKGSQYYNDGIRNFKVDAGVEPDPSWIKGMIIDPDVQARINESNRKKFTGSQFWNDGIKNYLVFVGQEPESHWVKGMIVDDAMLKRNRESAKKRIAGCTVYNDGNRAFKVPAGGTPESHWVKGYLPRLAK